jgi:Tfp pilus assembly protein PilO
MTPLTRRIVQEHRTLLIALASGLAINILAYAFVVYPRSIKAAGAADRAAVATASLRAAERERDAARALVTGKTQADEELTAFYDKVLPASHEDAVRMTFASLPALARKSGVTFARRSSTVEQQRAGSEEMLRHLQITMVLQGSYENFRRFIYELESAPEFLIVDDVVLTESSPNEPLTFVITMSTYFRAKDHGA